MIPQRPSCLDCGGLELEYRPNVPPKGKGFFPHFCPKCIKTHQMHFLPTEYPVSLRLALGLDQPVPEASELEATLVQEPETAPVVVYRRRPARVEKFPEEENMNAPFDLSVIRAKVDNFKKLKDAGISGAPFEAGRRELAEIYKALTLQAKELENLTEPLEGALKTSGLFTEFFPDLMKVGLQEGATITEIDNAVANKLTHDELLKIVKVTEKSLKDIGREDLILAFKVTTGEKKAPSLYCKPVTAPEKKLILEGGDPRTAK